ncbi:MAG: 3-keto-5-aminohexanoate cleavage protein [Suipraeoptans sp.]
MNIDNKVMISVVPVAATDKNINPEKIANDVYNCYKEGAAMVHLHVRNKNGSLTRDMDVFTETVELIKEKCDIIIEASTGGVSDLTISERCAPIYYDKVETCSLNVGSTNLGDFVYKNPIPEVKYCVEKLIENKKKPEVEVFEIGHINMMMELQEMYNIPSPILYTIVLGHPGEAPATPKSLMAMVNFIPNDAIWGITHAYRRDFGIIAAALGLGAKTVRIGFEDSNYINPQKTIHENAPLVEKTANLIKAMDKEVMTSEEARAYFSIN